METKIFEGSINGIDLKFVDLINSGTPSCVFTELQRDDYGLEQISLQPQDTVIDIGANIGMFSIYVKKKFGCNIISFEPIPINFENFKTNIEINGLSLYDFQLHNIAISSKDNDTIKIGTPDYNSGGSSIFHICDIISECQTQTLHKYINESCVYLKIDTEGAEYDIVPSIIKELNNFKYIGIEYHKFRDYHNPMELHKMIKSNYDGCIFCQEPTA
jgi:hypothetical protein